LRLKKNCLCGLSPRETSRSAAICPCGEVIGANYYAWQHNPYGENTTPILIEFEASDDAMSIDGRDFLYTVFQLGELALPALVRTFHR
jgi:hypothetical protein